MNRLSLATYLILFFFAACQEQVLPESPNDQDIEVFDNVKLLSKEAAKEIHAVHPNKIIFTKGASLKEIQRGDMLISDIADSLSLGLLKKVVSKSDSSNFQILSFEDASIEEVIKHGSLKIKLSEADLIPIDANPKTTNFPFFHDDIEGLEISGNVNIGVQTLFFESRFQNGQFMGSDTEISLACDSDIDVLTQVEILSIDADLDIYEFKFYPIRVLIPTPIGPLPLVVVVELEGELALELEAMANLHLEASASFAGRAGYNTQSGPYSHLEESNLTGSMQTGGKLSLGLWQNNEVEISLNGSRFFEGSAGIRPGYKASAELTPGPDRDVICRIDGLIEAHAGLRLIRRLFFEEWELYNKNVFEYSKDCGFKTLSDSTEGFQTGTVFNVKVHVSDDCGSVEGERVDFSTLYPGESVSPSVAYTDNQGFASTIWISNAGNFTQMKACASNHCLDIYAKSVRVSHSYGANMHSNSRWNGELSYFLQIGPYTLRRNFSHTFDTSNGGNGSIGQRGTEHLYYLNPSRNAAIHGGFSFKAENIPGIPSGRWPVFQLDIGGTVGSSIIKSRNLSGGWFVDQRASSPVFYIRNTDPNILYNGGGSGSIEFLIR